jgi:hypothetical protein
MCHDSKASLDGKFVQAIPTQQLLLLLASSLLWRRFDVKLLIFQTLQVWGLFAPKYVFDAIGLLLTDLLICLASLYYS